MPNLAPYAVKDMSKNTPIPEGTYRLRIAGFEFSKVTDDFGQVAKEWKEKHPESQAETDFLQGQFVVQDEENGGVVTLGRRLYITLTFKRGGDWLLRSLIEACGKDEDWMLIDEQGQPHWDDLKEQEVMGVVTLQPEKEGTGKYAGRKFDAKNEVKKFLPLIS